MRPVEVSPLELQALLAEFSQSGVLGIAVGAKEKAGIMNFERPAVTFFVDEKVALPEGVDSLPDGRRAIPPELTLSAGRFETDVIPVGDARPGNTGVRTGKPVFVPGGLLISGNRQGTMAMLVRSNADQTVLALTNHHVAPAGSTAEFYREVTIMMRRPTVRSIPHAERTELFDDPHGGQSRMKVDASAISIATSQLDLVANAVPNFGRIAAIAETPIGSAVEYSALIGQRVYSYSRIAKQRFGRISHTTFQFVDTDGANSSFCMLIRGENGLVPGFPGDSGKLWMRRGVLGNEALALHLGEFFEGATGTRYAAATDLAALSRLWDFSLF